jgi:tetratricopeptide (TPR) repeat protein
MPQEDAIVWVVTIIVLLMLFVVGIVITRSIASYTSTGLLQAYLKGPIWTLIDYWGKKHKQPKVVDDGDDAAIKNNPNDAMTFIRRGDAYYESGAYEQAIADYNEAIRRDPKNDVAISNRGFANLKMKRVSQALADFDAALRLNPRNEEAIYGRDSARNHTEVNGD